MLDMATIGFAENFWAWALFSPLGPLFREGVTLGQLSESEVALLDRARIALLGMRSGHAQLKAAELSALARKLSALATAQGAEARMADAVATSAELTHQEADLAAAELEAAMKPLAIARPAPAADEEELEPARPARSRLPLA